MKYTRTERAIWIKQWQESGLSKADFCRQHALDLKRFYSWFGQRSDPLADKTHFSKVILHHSNPEKDWIESPTLHCANGSRLEFSTGIRADLLITLIQSLA